MDFRELAWSQQLQRQRMLYGPAAEATEKSYPKYPAAALRELVRQSKHPHNLEPLLLTLRRPANADTRRRLAEIAGELVLVERALSDDVICEDLQIVVGNRVEDAPDGMLYPDKASQVPYEVWVRAELLDALALMMREGLVRSLSPVMAAKLVADLLDRSRDAARSPLVRGYALRAAQAAVASLNAVRAEAARPGGEGNEALVRAACDALRLATQPGGAAAAAKAAAAAPAEGNGAAADGEASEANGSSGGGAPAQGSAPALTNPYAADPIERLKLLAAACEALYMAAAGPDAAAGAAFPAAAAGRRLGDATRLPNVSALAAAGAGPLLARALEAAAAALRDRRAAAGEAAKAAARDEATAERFAAGELSFEDNWGEYLRTGLTSATLAADAACVVALGGALLQLLARTGAEGDERAWPSEGALGELAAGGWEGVDAAVPATAAALQAGHGDDAPAVVGLPAFAALAASALARRCCQCGASEAAGAAPLKRCGACSRAFYCSEKCQKAAWGAGHKLACKQLAAAAKAAA
ncbi:hypothetical protein Rsub_12914 [Raphidocelis subcapitata]|uniref:MYND-type domain-containing protein n=1 Tax=Raphidocelis subcapitata TaxID=307507 RepID=A0A2V0PLZ1_9CHLO|nr:hypothetical protein Rsub_12914 [Raphidocelis subcapitata]|eukprot:GBG00093.1 hypothetical protein Rsub_12914 [Raphidocelis subcapitata]